MAEWQAAWKKTADRRAKKLELMDRLRGAVSCLLDHAAWQPEPWSQRPLSKKIGIAWATWLRCRNGKVNARTWLPKLEAAIVRLNIS
ncbi:MAG TPA: hypothetical protein VGN23_13125 [Verrucomicrobiae bacterium]